MSVETEGAVTQDVDTAATESTANPTEQQGQNREPASPTTATAQPARNGTENAIPHWRVEEMRKKDREEVTALRKKIEEMGGVMNKVNDGFTAFGRGLGFIKDPEPKYVDEATYTKSMESLKREMSESFQQEMQIREMRAQWDNVSSRHAKWVKVPGFKQACLDEYVQTGRPLMEIADSYVDQYAKMFAAQKAAEAEAGEAEREKAKVVKPGGGAGAPSTKPTKGSISDRIRASLKG